ncbi:MAG: cell wall hydrolase [Sphingomicrobium sp.]
MLILGALSASSVAPAQVGSASEPLIPISSAALPRTVVPSPLSIELAAPQDTADAPVADPLAPLPGTQPAPRHDYSGLDLGSLVSQLRSSQTASRELECLAVGIYYESKSEPLAGQLAVGEVIANRANSNGRFPSSYCGVLFQRSQFSFIHGRALPSVPRSSRQWQTAVAIAQIVDKDLRDSAAPKALFFHARRVSPNWKLKRVASIGNHIFYR